MKLKNKLALGLAFLFVLTMSFGTISMYYIQRLSSDANKILKNNQETLLYCSNMLNALEDLRTNDTSLGNFEKNLVLQERNITEPGENVATQNLRTHFTILKSNLSDSTQYAAIRRSIYSIETLNQQAIVRKNGVAQSNAKDAAIWLTIIFTVIAIISFTFVVNFPSVIANPIKTLLKGITDIANKNYKSRIHLKQHDEFGELAASFNTMAAKLEEYESSNLARILFEKKRIEAIVNNMHDPVIGLDEQMHVLFVNGEALQVTGLTGQDITGRLIQDIAVNNDLVRTLITDIVQNKEAPNRINREPLKIYAHGKESFFEKDILNILSPPADNNERVIIGYVIILKNITPFKELDFAKTNFIATVSHELKTPISSIKMSLQLLEDERIGDTNGEQKQLVQNIRDEADRLLKITGELLNITQVETGKMQLNIHPANVKDIVQYAVEAVKTEADQKHISINTFLPGNLPFVLADKEKTAWVITNLLSNAVHYSYDNNRVLLNVQHVNDSIQFTVQDFGKGIDARYIDKIFDRYFKIPGSRQEGTGLGLAISKEFIEVQGGSITVSSETGVGSIFTVQLKVAVAVAS
ncbi:MAG TPA: ATP-binding protein [Chitinophagaceae bacterium]|nr:ATP-binding protein [Chitinophagaceae bacterium]